MLMWGMDQTDELLVAGFAFLPLLSGGAPDLRQLHIDVGGNRIAAREALAVRSLRADAGVQAVLPHASLPARVAAVPVALAARVSSYTLGAQGAELTVLAVRKLGQAMEDRTGNHIATFPGSVCRPCGRPRSTSGTAAWWTSRSCFALRGRTCGRSYWTCGGAGSRTRPSGTWRDEPVCAHADSGQRLGGQGLSTLMLHLNGNRVTPAGSSDLQLATEGISAGRSFCGKGRSRERPAGGQAVLGKAACHVCARTTLSPGVLSAKHPVPDTVLRRGET